MKRIIVLCLAAGFLWGLTTTPVQSETLVRGLTLRLAGGVGGAIAGAIGGVIVAFLWRMSK